MIGTIAWLIIIDEAKVNFFQSGKLAELWFIRIVISVRTGSISFSFTHFVYLYVHIIELFQYNIELLIIPFIVHSFLDAWLDGYPTILLNATLDRRRSSPRAVPSIVYHCRNQLEPCTLKNKNRRQHSLSLVPETDF